MKISIPRIRIAFSLLIASLCLMPHGWADQSGTLRFTTTQECSGGKSLCLVGHYPQGQAVTLLPNTASSALIHTETGKSQLQGDTDDGCGIPYEVTPIKAVLPNNNMYNLGVLGKGVSAFHRSQLEIISDQKLMHSAETQMRDSGMLGRLLEEEVAPSKGALLSSATVVLADRKADPIYIVTYQVIVSSANRCCTSFSFIVTKNGAEAVSLGYSSLGSTKLLDQFSLNGTPFLRFETCSCEGKSELLFRVPRRGNPEKVEFLTPSSC